MRLLRRVSGIGWLTGAVLLVGSLALLLFGLPRRNEAKGNRCLES